jgi:hypothetical protein
VAVAPALKCKPSTLTVLSFWNPNGVAVVPPLNVTVYAMRGVQIIVAVVPALNVTAYLYESRPNQWQSVTALNGSA